MGSQRIHGTDVKAERFSKSDVSFSKDHQHFFDALSDNQPLVEGNVTYTSIPKVLPAAQTQKKMFEFMNSSLKFNTS